MAFAGRRFERVDLELERANVQVVAVVDFLRAIDLLTVEERAIGAVEVVDEDSPVLNGDRAVAPANERAAEPELAVFIPANQKRRARSGTSWPAWRPPTTTSVISMSTSSRRRFEWSGYRASISIEEGRHPLAASAH